MLTNTTYRMIKRAWRERELTLLIVSLVIALLCFTSISLLTKSIEMTMGINSSEFLGGNVVLSSSTPIPKTWETEARSYHLTQARSVNFMSVLSANNQWQLSSIKAVSSNYPLFGELKFGDTPYQYNPELKQPLKSNTILLGSRLYNSLGIKHGDQVQVGNAKLTSLSVLINDPITGQGFFNFAPKALITLDDLAKTQVIQPGSRIDYRWYLKGNEKEINQFSKWIKSKLNPTQKLYDANKDHGSLNTAFNRVDAILKCSILMALSLTAIAITIAIRQFIFRQKKTMALFRCFGMSNTQVLLTYSTILFILCTIGITLGIFLGIAAQHIIGYFLQNYLLMPTFSFTLSLIPRAYLIGLLLSACVSLPWLWQILHISPNQLLTEQSTPMKNKQTIAWLVALAIGVAGCYFVLQDIVLLRIIAGGYLVTIAALLILNTGYAKLLLLYKNRLSVGYRYGFLNIVRHRWYAFAQITAFSLTFTTLLVLTLMSQSLLREWQNRLTPDIPNYFIFNFTKDQAEPISNLIFDTTQKTPSVYPMVRGRITLINNKATLDAVPKNAKNNNALHRALNLSTMKSLPEDNEITRGSWWDKNIDNTPSISVEEDLAESLGISLGDKLTFTIGATPVSGIVTNLRRVNWSSLHPNFYFIFSPGSLNNFSASYISSFYLTDTQDRLLLTLAKEYPNITIIDVGDIISQIRTALTNLRYLIIYLTAFILLAGISLLYASVLATLDLRQNETHILRLLGAGPKIILQSLFAEFGGLGLASTATAVLVAQLMLFSLSRVIGFVTYHWLWVPNMLTLVLGTIMITAIGTLSLKISKTTC